MMSTKTPALAVACLLLAALSASAQLPPPSPASNATRQSLSVQVVLSRFQGEKKVSSLPYTMTVTTGARPTNLRMGAQVPIVGAGEPGGSPSFTYRDVGTSIDCSAQALDDGRYSVQITIEDSSVYADAPSAAPAQAGHPSFRSFQANETLVLGDGQSVQYTTATDKITGEVMKVDVTMKVVK